MKILFYLPVITLWWFDKIITPMLRNLAGDAEVSELHLMVAQPWRNTGLHDHDLILLAGMAKLQVHWVDQAWGENAAQDFRLDASAVPGLLDRIAAINPDLTLARSADVATPRSFPGRVRFITEGGAPPYRTDQRWIVLDEEPFRIGLLPGQAHAMAAQCIAFADTLPVPQRSVDDARARLLLPDDRPVLAVPLHYEHDENFYLCHAAFPDGMAQIQALLDHTDPDVLLAVTDHPLNRLHVDRSALKAALAELPERIVLSDQDDATPLLTACADAVVTDLSKAWSLAAFNGTPIVHMGRQPLAPWLHAVPDLAELQHAGPWQDLPVADPASVKLWFGWHLGARLLDPRFVTLPALLRRFDDRPEDEDFQRNLAALERQAMVPA